jgi:hypothetical protein
MINPYNPRLPETPVHPSIVLGWKLLPAASVLLMGTLWCSISLLGVYLLVLTIGGWNWWLGSPQAEPLAVAGPGRVSCAHHLGGVSG